MIQTWCPESKGEEGVVHGGLDTVLPTHASRCHAALLVLDTIDNTKQRYRRSGCQMERSYAPGMTKCYACNENECIKKSTTTMSGVSSSDYKPPLSLRKDLARQKRYLYESPLRKKRCDKNRRHVHVYISGRGRVGSGRVGSGRVDRTRPDR